MARGDKHTQQKRMALLIAMLLAAAYAVDRFDPAPPKRPARRRPKETKAALPPPPPIPRQPPVPAPPTTLHPIFQQLAQQDTAKLFQPALQLASRFLTSNCFLSYWYVVFYSPVTELPLPTTGESSPTTTTTTTQPGTRHFAFTADLPTHLTRSQIALTTLALADLATCLTFDLRSPSPERAGGRCKHLRHLPAPPRAFRGHARCIQTSSYFHDMHNHPAVSEADRVWLLFELAKTLLHEVAHAAVNAARGKGSGEHYFLRGGSVAEEGFQLEACLLGGKVDLRRGEFHEAVAGYGGGGYGAGSEDVGGGPLIRGYLTPWPSWEAVEEYRVRGSLIGIRGPVPRHPRGREVRFERVRRLFTDEGWEEDVRRFGSLRLC
ncbi:hypothetical protein B0A55_08194 [Friedmanniomyces simplex]|uniref:SprT-like domain-containing protein n=1 Tax=Friedmanniomyces simplex TaxID=329884 RepID=A0A4U0WUR0_9PEZI|nr:hypothetical protein B0A55_08194 [Friedmanniomyces simplex]